jgi:hypothetical protein
MACGQDIFKWSVQLAGYDDDRADQKGEIDYGNFTAEFRKFPWIEHIRDLCFYGEIAGVYARLSLTKKFCRPGYRWLIKLLFFKAVQHYHGCI